ncbi:PAS domain S-box protein [Candidatus Latescibacterota bacterium]
MDDKNKTKAQLISELEELRKRVSLNKEIEKVDNQADEAWKKSESDLSNALKIAKMGHWEFDVLKNQFTFTDEFYSMLHTSAEEMGGYTMSPEKYTKLFIHPDDFVPGEEGLQELSESPDPDLNFKLRSEHRILYADGGIGYIEVYIRLIKDEDGQLIKTIGVNHDITDRKEAEDARKKSESNLSNALKIAKMGHWEYDALENQFTFTDEFYSIFHTTAEEMGGYTMSRERYFEQFVHPDDMNSIIKGIKKADETINLIYDRKIEHKILYADGSMGHLEVYTHEIKDENGKRIKSFGISHDITERKKSEDALKKSESDLSNALNIAKMGHWEYDALKNKFTFTDELYSILHTTAEEMGGYTMSREKYIKLFIHPDDILPAQERLQELAESNDRDSELHLEHRVLYADGGIGYLEVYFRVIKDGDGQLIKSIGVNQDITEKKQAQEELHESELFLKSVINESPFAIFITDASGTLHWANPALKKFLNLNDDQLVGKYNVLEDILLERQGLSPLIRSVFEEGKSIRFNCDWDGNDIPNLDLKGSNFVSIDATMFPIHNSQGEMTNVVTNWIDITDRKEAEEALKKSESDLSNALKIAKMGHWEYDVLEDLFTFTDEFYSLYHTTAEEMGGYTMTPKKYIKYFVHPDDIAKVSINPDDIETVLGEMHEKNEIIGEIYNILEHKILYADGKPGYVAAYTRIITDEDGRIIKSIGVNQDITERKKAEEALKKSESDLSKALQISKMGHWEFDVLKNQFTFTDEFYSIFHTTAENIGGYTMSRERYIELFVHPDDIIPVTEGMKNANKPAGNIFDRKSEHKMLFADGSMGYVEVYTHDIKDENGKRIKAFGVNHDITDRVKAEEALKKSESNLSLALKIAKMGHWEFDALKNQFTFTDEFYSIFHTTAEEMGGYTMTPEKYLKNFVHPDEISLVGEAMQESSETNDPNYRRLTDHRILYADGGIGYIEVYNSIVKDAEGRTIKVFGANHDITERKKAEEALYQAVTLLEAQLNSTLEGIIVVDTNGKKILQNKRTAELWNIPKHIADNDDDNIQVQYVMNMTVEPEKFVKSIKYLYDHPNETTHDKIELIDGTTLDRYSAPVLGKNGKNLGRIWTFHDITYRKKADAALKKSESNLSHALNIAKMGHWEFDAIENQFTFTDEFYSILHTSAEKMGGYTMPPERYMKLFVYPADIPLLVEGLEKLNDSANTDDKPQLVHRILYADGGIGYIEVHVRLIKDEDGQIIKSFGVNHDITEHKQLEDEQLKASKLESIGLLAGGIAHDFNNILAAILGNTSIVKFNIEKNSEDYELLTETENAIVRATKLTHQLLTFAKGGAPVKEIANLSESIGETTEFTLRGTNVNYQKSIDSDLWNTEVDKGQISQVINNLVINAQQAMPNGGTINITAKNVKVELKDTFPFKEGNYIKISFSDTGQGIPADRLKNIFDPYFTSKQSGSGLGLATSYSIIRRHNGHIDVKSIVGEGSTFTIYLPASNKQVVKKGCGEEMLKDLTGKILVMDDEISIQKVTEAMLKRYGYDVVVASDGAETIKLYKKAIKAGEPFDVVVMDLTIPGGMGGEIAIKKLLEIDPDAKAIVSSGYSNNPVISNFKDYGFIDYISKPYKFEELRKKLNNVLK